MSARPDLSVGSVFAGYRLEALAGRGGMGVVYRARDVSTGHERALKVIAPQWSADERFRARFERESRHAARLDHPNVIQLYAAGEEGGLLYLVMSYVEGRDLASLLREQGHLEPRRALGIVGQVAAALDYAHARGLVHRDVKPANIMLQPVREGVEHAYLTDFGLVKDVSSDSSLSTTGVFIGTPEYAAPEQLDPAGTKNVDGRTDVYALACVLYTALSGEPPYPRTSLQALIAAHLLMDPPDIRDKRPELPAGLGPVLQRAMAKEPNRRYASAGGLVRAAWRAIEDTVEVPAPRRRTAPLALVGAAVAAVGALAAIASLFVTWFMWNSFTTGRLHVMRVSGWQAFHLPDLAILAASLVVLAVAAVSARRHRLPLLAVAAFAGVGILAIAVYALAWDPGAQALVAGESGPTNAGHGPLIAAAAGALVIVGALLGLARNARPRA